MDSIYLALREPSMVGSTKINSMRCKKTSSSVAKLGLLTLFQSQREMILALPVLIRTSSPLKIPELWRTLGPGIWG